MVQLMSVDSIKNINVCHMVGSSFLSVSQWVSACVSLMVDAQPLKLTLEQFYSFSVPFLLLSLLPSKTPFSNNVLKNINNIE